MNISHNNPQKKKKPKPEIDQRSSQTFSQTVNKHFSDSLNHSQYKQFKPLSSSNLHTKLIQYKKNNNKRKTTISDWDKCVQII